MFAFFFICVPYHLVNWFMIGFTLSCRSYVMLFCYVELCYT